MCHRWGLCWARNFVLLWYPPKWDILKARLFARWGFWRYNCDIRDLSEVVPHPFVDFNRRSISKGDFAWILQTK